MMNKKVRNQVQQRRKPKLLPPMIAAGMIFAAQTIHLAADFRVFSIL